jgi:DNA-damage-inducible protein D
MLSQSQKLDSSSEPIAFTKLREVNRYGQEFWSARKLAKALGFSSYRRFIAVVQRAKRACQQSGYKVEDHFEDTLEFMVGREGRRRKVATLHLSRYACYLIVQNAEPDNETIAQAQTYFAIQARKQELLEEADQTLSLNHEDQSRLLLRNEMTRHNKKLAEAASRAGVAEAQDFSAFQNLGYQGLYGGLDQKQIHDRKALKKSQRILDYMGSTELAANLFRATQTEEKLRRDRIQGKKLAYQMHYNVGQKVRQTIKELGGTMPENLHTPSESIKAIERKQVKSIIKNIHAPDH